MNPTTVITKTGRKLIIEHIQPDPFNTMTRTENIKDGYKVTTICGSSKIVVEFFKWFRHDGSVYGTPIGIKMVDAALALLEK